MAIVIRGLFESKEHYEARKAAAEARAAARKEERAERRDERREDREDRQEARRADREEARDARREDREDRMQIRQAPRRDRIAAKDRAGYWTPEAVKARSASAATIGAASANAAGVVGATVAGSLGDGLDAAGDLLGEDKGLNDFLAGIGGDVAEAGATAAVDEAVKKAVPWLIGGGLLLVGLWAMSGNSGGK